MIESLAICSEPACNKLTRQGRCEQHRQEARGKRGDPFYTGRPWRRVRLKKLQIDPTCELMLKCEGKPATEVHHVKKRKDNPELAYSYDNLQSACKTCHNTITGKGK